MIAVVVRVWAPRFIATVYAIPVVVPRCEPECCDAEIFQIGQLVDYAAQVTAVKAAWVVAIVGFGWRVFRIVVRWIPVNEAIRHDQVDHVVGRDALEIGLRIERRFETEWDHGAPTRTLHKQRILSRRQWRADLDVYEKIRSFRVN